MKGHVLIVDDNINNLRIAVDILIHEKLRITTAKCGADALKALERNRNRHTYTYEYFLFFMGPPIRYKRLDYEVIG